MPLTVQTTRYRQGTSLAVGTIIDGYLSDKETEKVYARWKSDWPEKLAFSGNQPGITFEMIREVPRSQLNRVFGPKFAAKLVQMAAEYGD